MATERAARRDKVRTAIAGGSKRVNSWRRQRGYFRNDNEFILPDRIATVADLARFHDVVLQVRFLQHELDPAVFLRDFSSRPVARRDDENLRWRRIVAIVGLKLLVMCIDDADGFVIAFIFVVLEISSEAQVQTR